MVEVGTVINGPKDQYTVSKILMEQELYTLVQMSSQLLSPVIAVLNEEHQMVGKTHILYPTKVALFTTGHYLLERNNCYTATIFGSPNVDDDMIEWRGTFEVVSLDGIFVKEERNETKSTFQLFDVLKPKLRQLVFDKMGPFENGVAPIEKTIYSDDGYLSTTLFSKIHENGQFASPVVSTNSTNGVYYSTPVSYDQWDCDIQDIQADLDHRGKRFLKQYGDWIEG